MQNDDEGGGGLRQFFPSSHSVLFPVLHPFHPFFSLFLSSFLFIPSYLFLFISSFSFLCSLQFSRVKEENYVWWVGRERRENQRVKKRKDKLFLSLSWFLVQRKNKRRKKEQRKREREKGRNWREGRINYVKLSRRVVTLFSCCKKILPLVPLLLFLSCFIGKKK